MTNNESLEELQERLNQVEGDEEKVETLTELAYLFHSRDPVQGQVYAEKALELAKLIAEPKAEALANRMYGLVLSVRGQMDSAIEYIEKAIPVFESNGDFNKLGRAYNDLGIIHGEQGNYAASLKAFFNALHICEKIGDMHGIALEFGNIGVSYEIQGILDKALHYQQKALQKWKLLEDSSAVAQAYTNLGNILIKQGRFIEALSHAQAAHDLAHQSHEVTLQANAHQLLGHTYSRIGQLDLAQKAMQKACDLHQSLDTKPELARDHFYLGNLFRLQNNFPTAKHHFLRAIKLAQVVGAKQTLMDCYEQLSQLYSSEQQFEQALDTYKKYVQIQSEIYDAKKAAAIAEVETRYRSAQQVAEAEILRLRTDELEQRVEERTQELKAAVIREKSLASRLKLALNREHELSQLKSQIIDVVSHEFRTPLTVINSSSYMLYNHYAKLSDKQRVDRFDRIQAAIQNITRLLDDALMFNMVDTLKIPPILDPIDLCALCQQLVADIPIPDQDRKRIKFVCISRETAQKNGHDCQKEMVELDFNVYLPQERIRDIIWQVLSNALKFSPPDQPVMITLIACRSSVLIEVVDHGIGIPTNEQTKVFDSFYRASNVGTKRGLGLGLTIAREVARALLGDISINSNGQDLGSKITISLPRNIIPVDD